MSGHSTSEYNHQNYLKNREKVLERTKKYNKDNKTKLKIYRTKWEEQNRNKRKISHKSNLLKKAYGIDYEYFLLMYKEQGGLCSICNLSMGIFVEDLGRANMAVIDHDHEDGQIRSLLHMTCNVKLHSIEDSIFMNQAIKYLNTFKGD